MCVHVKLLQSCPTLFDSMDRSPPGSAVHGISQARILEWAALPSSRGFSQPRDKTCISYVSCLLYQACSLALGHLGSPGCTDGWREIWVCAIGRWKRWTTILIHFFLPPVSTGLWLRVCSVLMSLQVDKFLFSWFPWVREVKVKSVCGTMFQCAPLLFLNDLM